jgi:transposase-like protein
MFDATKKADTVRRHLRDKVPVSELAAELDVQPTLIHQWIHQVLTQAERAFESSGKNPSAKAAAAEQRRLEQLEAKIQQKNEVIAELMEESLKLKKASGGP